MRSAPMDRRAISISTKWAPRPDPSNLPIITQQPASHVQQTGEGRKRKEEKKPFLLFPPALPVTIFYVGNMSGKGHRVGW